MTNGLLDWGWRERLLVLGRRQREQVPAQEQRPVQGRVSKQLTKLGEV
jgi:hypothetical protein